MTPFFIYINKFQLVPTTDKEGVSKCRFLIFHPRITQITQIIYIQSGIIIKNNLRHQCHLRMNYAFRHSPKTYSLNFTTISTGLSSSFNPSAMVFNSPLNSPASRASIKVKASSFI